ncbi:phosphatidylinositol transfer protein [Sorangium sp. So ce1036]|uniref:lipin/Ned1/Smp2 family protein n=1 Tax=Sorangium sp. So ce1036 TaxID=3133328 RepID=UPI003EFCEFD5
MQTKILLVTVMTALAIGCGSADAASLWVQDGDPAGGAEVSSDGDASSGDGEGPDGGEMSSGDGSGDSGDGDASSGDGSGDGVPGALCDPLPACDTAPPDPGDQLPWNHVSSYLIAGAGAPNHRGRDLYLTPDDPQWIIGKFSYGLSDKDLKDEQVDIYLLRDCSGAWEHLGATSTTAEDSAHPEIEGVSDSGGRVYFEIPADRRLGPGRHRVHLVVRGDRSSTDLFIEIVPRGAPIFVSDVDGTLTGTETEEFTSLLIGRLPDVHPHAAAAFHRLVVKGYRPMYLTARPEWLVQRTRDFLDAYGFPPGIVHTTLGLTGATGDGAVEYKTAELAHLLDEKGLLPAWAFGNTATDAEAYDNAGVTPLARRVFYRFDDRAHGGRRIDTYAELLAEIDALPSLCD